MAKRTVFSKQNLVITSSIFVFYFIMKILILATTDSVWDYRATSRNADSNNLLVASYLQFVMNSTLESNLDNDTCQWNMLGVPSFVLTAGCTGRYCQSITCKKLLSGDAESIEAAADFTKSHRRKVLTDEQVLKLAMNCSELYSLGRYQRVPLRASDPSFPIAFNILIHMQAEQFERLLRSIYRPQNLYCIHVDAKASWSFHAAVGAIAKCFDNVFVATRRQRIVYAGFSRLQADIDCMKDHLSRPAAVRWRYLMNVAGQAYPLRTPEEMIDILRIYNGSNDIEGLSSRRRIFNRFNKIWRESYDLGKMVATNASHARPPYDIDIVRGSGYGIFSRSFVEFIINDKRAMGLLEWSRHTYSPDEHYWSTLHHLYSNPHLRAPGGYRGRPESKEFLAVYVKWYPEVKCAGYWKRGICILGVGDLPDLLTRKEFFVNKFELDSQPLAFECIEAWLQQRVLCPAPLDLDFYRRLRFVTSH